MGQEINSVLEADGTQPPVGLPIQRKGPPEGVTGVQTSIGTVEGVSKGKLAESTGPAAGPNAPAVSTGPPGTPLTILKGASVQGSPKFIQIHYNKERGQDNSNQQDKEPHTVTSGTGPTKSN